MQENMHTFCQKEFFISVSKSHHYGDKLTETKSFDDFKAIIIFSEFF